MTGQELAAAVVEYFRAPHKDTRGVQVQAWRTMDDAGSRELVWVAVHPHDGGEPRHMRFPGDADVNQVIPAVEKAVEEAGPLPVYTEVWLVEVVYPEHSKEVFCEQPPSSEAESFAEVLRQVESSLIRCSFVYQGVEYAGLEGVLFSEDGIRWVRWRRL